MILEKIILSLIAIFSISLMFVFIKQFDEIDRINREIKLIKDNLNVLSSEQKHLFKEFFEMQNQIIVKNEMIINRLDVVKNATVDDVKNNTKIRAKICTNNDSIDITDLK